ncbi:hypothetical protein QBC41DRAFT_157065 [Cercophora samala]|uniref:Uncharacterized protein n=1 Tax=Cercophora samala TaxID=330535 RepID=A0AA39Z8E4_9PEZI|nr:hypothetical protein QBC41DRAFT_157065 [Cercophora samala]
MENEQPIDLEWLADLSKGQSFTTFAQSQSAKTLDFGDDGFTASLSEENELLQLTRPDPTCGLIFVRGKYPDSAASILARAQARHQYDVEGNETFGTNLVLETSETPSSSWAVNDAIRKTQGWVNFRWPYAQYELFHLDPALDVGRDVGSCDTISFVRDKTLFQIHRLRLGAGTSATSNDHQDDEACARFKIGGPVRFGCPCSQSDIHREFDTYTITNNANILSCRSENYGARIEMSFSINGTPQHLALRNPNNSTTNVEWVDMTSEHEVEIRVDEPTYVVSTYAVRADDEAEHDSSLPTDLANYLGVSRGSVNMTDRLWTSLCGANYEAIEAVEFCVVGRGVEQILGVTSIPTLALGSQPTSRSFSDELGERALIGNIMTCQFVDVESAFYQIRLLAKLHQFINSRELKRDFLHQYLELQTIREAYLDKLTAAIQGALAWLFATDLKPGRLLLAVHSSPFNMSDGPAFNRLERCAGRRARLNWDMSYNRGCYATMAAWYAYMACPSAFSSQFIDQIIVPRLPVAYQLGMERANRDKQPTPKSNVLQWLHLSSILLLYDELGCAENELDIDIEEVRETQEKIEKHVSRLKTNQQGGWKAHHDELDRALLLAEEMHLDRWIHNSRSYTLAVSRAKQTRQRIRERKRTAKFLPGPKPWMVARGLSNGPWELHCVNHEAYLRVADVANVSAARDRLFEFLLSDYSFMTSWDWADANMVGRWWDIRPTAMICATLLDLKSEGKLQAAPARKPVTDVDVSQFIDRRTDTLRSDDLTSSGILPREPKALGVGGESGNLEAVLIKLLQSVEESRGSEIAWFFDWVLQRPPNRCFPVWYTSLPSPSWLPKNPLIALTGMIPELKAYTSRHGSGSSSTQPGFQLNATTTFDKECADLHLINLWDITHGSPSDFSFRINAITLATTLPTPTGTKSSNLERDHALKKRLDTPLMDLGIKHRILLFPTITPSHAVELYYLWHTAANFHLRDHFGSVSRFTDSKKGPTGWTTGVNISHWTIRSRNAVEKDPYREVHRQHGNFPPNNIAELGVNIDLQYMVEERSSSIIFTGDPSGRLWICSIISPTIRWDLLHNLISNHTRPLLSIFVHQPSTARCLVFMMFLGHLCETLASEYEKLLSKLDDIIEIRDRTLFEGPEDWWGTAEAINKLKKMLWGWDALRIFNDKLSASLTQIQRAHDAMDNHIKQEALHQDAELIQEASTVVDEFRKRHGLLVDVHDKMQLKIKQVTGLRDGISTITNVVDAQTALADNKTTIQQGNNIRTLTYITIGYLPLGFVTGLYSVQHGTFMNSATDWQFGVMIVLFSLGTWILAYALEKALVRFDWGIMRGHFGLKRLQWTFQLPAKHTRDRDRDQESAGDSTPLADLA